MLLLEASETVGQFLGEYGYLAAFLVLFLCGLGLPLPEEVTLIGSGLLYYRGEVEFVPIVLVCSAAILLGDSVPFWLGRRYGMSALKIRWVARVLHPERFARLRRRFEEHGNKATFACRFFPGIRIPGYFLAGTMGMRYSRFLLLDTLGVLVSVPASIYVGKLFGDSMDTLQSKVRDIHLILAFVAISCLLIMIVRQRRLSAARRHPGARTRLTDRTPADPEPPEGPDQAGG